MNVKLLLSTVVVGVMAVACAEGVGAAVPTQNSDGTAEPGRNIATSVPATVPGLASAEPTSTTVAPLSGRSTVEPERIATPVPTVRSTTVVPTATAVRFDPFATPTPLWTAVPSPTRVPTIAPEPTATAVVVPTVAGAPDDLFQPLLNYQYTVPAGWSARRTESSIVLADKSGKIKIEMTEQPVERWRFQTVIALGATTFPARPAGWQTWTSRSVGVIKSGAAYEFQFAGIKNSTNYLQFVQWYMWGDIHVQVAVEVPEFDWNSSPAVRSAVHSVIDGFQPHDGSHLLSSEDILAVMYERMDDRPSGVFMRNEAIRARYELTCREVFDNLLSAPEYLGNGLWQFTAQTLDGSEAWWVFEPTGSVMTLNSNNSRC